MIRLLRRILSKLADWNDPGCHFDQDAMQLHGIYVINHSRRRCRCQR